MAADGETLETATLLFEFMGQPLADRETIFGEANGRGHDLGEIHGAIGFQSESEAGDGARHGDRAIAEDGGFFIELAVFCDVHVPGGLGWRHFTVIEKRGLAIREPNQHEAAAADVACGGFYDRQRKRHGNGSVHSVAAAFENCDSRLRAKFFVGSDHAMAGANSLSRPAPGIDVTVAEFCRSLPPYQRRCQANDENTQKHGLSYAHAGSKTVSDSQDTVNRRAAAAILPRRNDPAPDGEKRIAGAILR